MSTVAIEPFFHYSLRRIPKFSLNSKKAPISSLNYTHCPSKNGASLSFGSRNSRPSPTLPPPLPRDLRPRASSSTGTAVVETSESSDVIFRETFHVKRPEKVEGKISVRLDNGNDEENWQLTVGCTLPGKWILHWGVNYVGDSGSEWDQPPPEMRPPGSILIKDYAVETPLQPNSTVSKGETFQEVKIDFNINGSSITAINFVLKDEETGAWYQHRGRDFKVPLIEYLDEDGNIVGAKKSFGIWPGALGQLSNMLLNSEGANPKGEDRSINATKPGERKRRLEGFYEEHSIVKETLFDNSVSVFVRHSPETAKNLLHIETDIPGDVVVHWGVCKDDKKWEIPDEPYPAETSVFKNKALRTLLQVCPKSWLEHFIPEPYPAETIVLKNKALETLLQRKVGGQGCQGSFTLNNALTGFVFVLKLNETTWLNYLGNDFYIPISNPGGQPSQSSSSQAGSKRETEVLSSSAGNASEVKQEGSVSTNEIISEIRNLVSDISSEKNRKTKSKEAQESILQEIEKLAAEAYSIFRSAISAYPETAPLEAAPSEAEVLKPPVKISSGTGSGYEILCQGFNWESHKSGRWYIELHDKASELSSLGFTVVWLPPPTESVSPEGYMPKDLYNLNSRYGNIEELKILVKKFHEVGIKVLGDVVLNHRCAHSKNQNGVWNIFGGRLNWDERAVVSDDPHFQGRGNKSSGDNFHAAPNIDHSQEFVRRDLKEWLCWLREEIGYDGWRLDFVRGFWGGYVKDYLDATEPYFALGEYWDSLSYTYGEMDYNQDAHRQRIVDWINATNGTAGAFDVTTKGILHSVLERCEYWRLSDPKGKPPGVLGWWPSRAVTFIENHDTGSTQGHWRFPRAKEMQGYAYILTHPGTPSVFYDHLFSNYHSEISKLLSLRKQNKIHCRSIVKITKAERDVYAAIIDEKVAMKIGPGYYEPANGAQRWSLAIEGKDYKVWQAS